MSTIQAHSAKCYSYRGGSNFCIAPILLFDKNFTVCDSGDSLKQKPLRALDGVCQKYSPWWDLEAAQGAVLLQGILATSPIDRWIKEGKK